MNEEEIRRRMEEARKKPPTWKRELLRKIDVLANEPGAPHFFRTNIRAVATARAEEYSGGKGREPKRLLGPGSVLTLPEKVFVLGAFHDAFREAERMSALMPTEWQGDLLRQVVHQGKPTQWFRTPAHAACCMYLGFSSECADLPDEQLQPAMLQRFFDEVTREFHAAAPRRDRPTSRRLFWPLVIWSALFAVLAVAVGWCAWIWGQGDNLWQKILASSWYLGIAFAVCMGGFLYQSREAGKRLLSRFRGER